MIEVDIELVRIKPNKIQTNMDSQVKLYVGLLAIIAFVHLVGLPDNVGLIVLVDHGRDGGSSLGRLLLQFLLASWINDHVDLARLVHDNLATIDEVLDLHSDIFGGAEVLLQVLIGLLELLDLLEPSGQLGLGIAFELLGLLDLFLGPPSLGRGLHQVRRVTLGHYKIEYM